MIYVCADPGKSSGFSVLRVTASSRPALVEVRQVQGGVAGFLSAFQQLQDRYRGATWIAEKFSPRPSSAAGFQQSLDTTLPLVCEGVMIGAEVMPVYTKSEPRWVSPSLQYIAGGKDKADKKRRVHRMLKDLGYYVTGKDVGCPDADDVRSSLAHSLGYLMRVEKHEPTYLAVSKWIEENQ